MKQINIKTENITIKLSIAPRTFRGVPVVLDVVSGDTRLHEVVIAKRYKDVLEASVLKNLPIDLTRLIKYQLKSLYSNSNGSRWVQHNKKISNTVVGYK